MKDNSNCVRKLGPCLGSASVIGSIIVNKSRIFFVVTLY
jgi:hypothetical protein